MSASEFPGRAVGTTNELLPALPEGSYLAFDPPEGRVKFLTWNDVWKQLRVFRSNHPFFGASSQRQSPDRTCVGLPASPPPKSGRTGCTNPPGHIDCAKQSLGKGNEM